MRHSRCYLVYLYFFLFSYSISPYTYWIWSGDHLKNLYLSLYMYRLLLLVSFFIVVLSRDTCCHSYCNFQHIQSLMASRLNSLFCSYNSDISDHWHNSHKLVLCYPIANTVCVMVQTSRFVFLCRPIFGLVRSQFSCFVCTQNQ